MRRQKKFDFTFSIQGKCPVHTSKKSLEKILSNLLSNAVAYTKPGCKITVILNARQIKIENECTPIPPEKLGAHVRAVLPAGHLPGHPHRQRRLGLAIAKEIVEAHGGTITAESPPEQVIFTVTLPVRGSGKKITRISSPFYRNAERETEHMKCLVLLPLRCQNKAFFFFGGQVNMKRILIFGGTTEGRGAGPAIGRPGL